MFYDLETSLWKSSPDRESVLEHIKPYAFLMVARRVRSGNCVFLTSHTGRKNMDLPRSARATRGKRMTKLLNEEIEADEEFWNQDALKEEVEDEEYKEEEEQVDEFDSDFDDDDDELQSDRSGTDEDEREPRRKKKKLLFARREIVAKKKGTAVRKSVSFKEQFAVPSEASEEKAKVSHAPDEKLTLSAHDSPEGIQEVDGERAIRKSTRMAVIVRQAERDALRALQPVSRSVKKKKGLEEERRMTQREMLQEAAQTEFMNLQSLQRMLAREEEVKKKAVIRKKLYTGPQIRFHSVNGRNVLKFTEMNTIPAIINARASPYPEQPLCLITGQPAKYRDPKTGLPYSTKEAFKVIRERFYEDKQPDKEQPVNETHQKKRTNVERDLDIKSRPGMVKLRYLKSLRSRPSEGVTTAAATEPRKILSNDATATTNLVTESPLQITVRAGSDQPVVSQRRMEHQCSINTAELSETNEADFLLEDLEVSLPSNFDSSLSFSGSHLSPYILDNNIMLGELDTEPIDMETDLLSFPPAGTGFFQWDSR